MSDKEAKLAAARKRALELKAKKGKASEDKSLKEEDSPTVIVAAEEDVTSGDATSARQADKDVERSGRVEELERLLAESVDTVPPHAERPETDHPALAPATG